MITLAKVNTPAGRGNCYGDRHFTERPVPEQIATCEGCPCLKECRAFGAKQVGADGLVFGGAQVFGRSSRAAGAEQTKRTLRCRWCGDEFTIVGGGRRSYCPKHSTGKDRAAA